MKITNTKRIFVPELRNDRTDEADEFNARMYNWINRTAIPTLKDNIIEPFENALKEDILETAKKEEELDNEELLNEFHSKNWQLGCVEFETRAYKHSSIAHESVYGALRGFVEQSVSDNGDNVHREFVRRTRNGIHLSTDHLLKLVDRWNSENIKVYNKQEARLVNREGISEENELIVALDTKRFKNIHQANAETYVRAKDIKKRLEGILGEFVDRASTLHGVNRTNGEFEVDYEFSDGGSVRYLFYPKEVSVKYAGMIEALTKPIDKKIVISTGDLVILRDLSFKEAYQGSGSGAVSVSTETLSYRLGKCTIDRGNKGVVEYSVLDNLHKGVYVGASGLLERMDSLKKGNTSGATQLKVDYFPGLF